jgi:hypothetical protein
MYGTTEKKMDYQGDGKRAVINRKKNFVVRSKVKDAFSSLTHVRRKGHEKWSYTVKSLRGWRSL